MLDYEYKRSVFLYLIVGYVIMPLLYILTLFTDDFLFISLFDEGSVWDVVQFLLFATHIVAIILSWKKVLDYKTYVKYQLNDDALLQRANRFATVVITLCAITMAIETLYFIWLFVVLPLQFLFY